MKLLLKSIFGNKKETVSKEIDPIEEEVRIRSAIKNEGQIQLVIGVKSGKDFKVLLKKDDFTGDELIKFTQVATYVKDKLITHSDENICSLNIGFRKEKDQDFITLDAYQKELKFNVDDKILFLLDTKEIIEFSVLEKGYKIDKESDGIICETKIPISNAQLNKFSVNRVLKWRYQSADSQQMTSTLNEEVITDFKDLASSFKSILEKNYFN